MPVITSEFPKWVNEVLCRTAEDEAIVLEEDAKKVEKKPAEKAEKKSDVNSSDDS